MNSAAESLGACHAAESERARRTILRTIFSFPALLGVLLFAGVFFGTLSQGTKSDTLFSEGDTWWHLRAGEDILRTHRVPHTDSYSWTAAGTGWIAYEWLGEVAMAEAYRLGGLRGLKLFQLLLNGGMLTLLYAYAALRSGNAKAAFVVCALITPVAAVFWSLRPQLCGYILFLVVLVLIERFRRGNNRVIWFLPVIFLIWVNLHGTFVFGFMALGIAWTCGLRSVRWNAIESSAWSPPQRSNLAIAALLSSMALFLTPYSSQLAAYPFDIGFLQPANIANVQEWLPVTAERFLAVVVTGLLLTFFIWTLTARTTHRLDDVLFVGIASLLATTHLRFVPLLLIVCVPLIAALFARILPRLNPHRDRPGLNAGLMVASLAAIAFFFPTTATLEKTFAEHMPVAAAAYLREHPSKGEMFNEYGWGGYLAWVRVPSSGVFIDGRADIYERAGVLQDYLSISRLEPGAILILKKYSIHICMLRRDAPLATVLAAMPDWRAVYADSLSVIYTRE
ncbi:MAG: hypothetical protein ACRD50_09060 [Candidatus Acidiferrales bacterium]